MNPIKHFPGDTIQVFLNSRWLMGVVLDHTNRAYDSINNIWDVEYGFGVLVSCPEFLGGKPLIIGLDKVKKLNSDLGKVLYE